MVVGDETDLGSPRGVLCLQQNLGGRLVCVDSELCKVSMAGFTADGATGQRLQRRRGRGAGEETGGAGGAKGCGWVAGRAGRSSDATVKQRTISADGDYRSLPTTLANQITISRRSPVPSRLLTPLPHPQGLLFPLRSSAPQCCHLGGARPVVEPGC